MTWLAALSFLKRIPWQAWTGLALIALFLWFRAHYIGIGTERCQSAHKAAEDQAQAKADQAAKTAQANAGKALAKVRAQTQEAANEARAITNALPATCPSQPTRLRELGQEAVRRAKASLPAAPNG